MLRWLVAGLVVANALFYAWSLGWLDDVVGVRARGDSDPARLARQVRPESVTILPPEGSSTPAGNTPSSSAGPNTPNAPAQPLAPSADTAATATVAAGTTGSAGEPASAPAAACLEAGPFTPAQAASAVALLQGAQPPLPAGSWADRRSEKPGSWIVYMGRYPNREALERKQEELRRVRGAVFEEVNSPPELSPGLSLGRFDQRVKAEQALEALALRGLRTARVVQMSAPANTHMLRADKVPGDIANQLLALRFDVPGRRFAPCGSN
jgi:hypothetical protein